MCAHTYTLMLQKRVFAVIAEMINKSICLIPRASQYLTQQKKAEKQSKEVNILLRETKDDSGDAWLWGG